ncbi:hypothetical protein ACK8N7_00675 [Streptomyces griseobrunneus]
MTHMEAAAALDDAYFGARQDSRHEDLANDERGQAVRELGTLEQTEPRDGDEAVRDELTRRAGGYVQADVDAWLARALAAHLQSQLLAHCPDLHRTIGGPMQPPPGADAPVSGGARGGTHPCRDALVSNATARADGLPGPCVQRVAATPRS